MSLNNDITFVFIKYEEHTVNNKKNSTPVGLRNSINPLANFHLVNVAMVHKVVLQSAAILRLCNRYFLNTTLQIR